MNLKNIIVNLSKYNNRNIENFQDTPTTSIANQTTAVITNENKKFYLELKIPDDVDKNFLEILLDDIRNKIDDIDNKDLQILFKNGDVSLKEMDEYLDKLLTKTSCRNEEDTCNISYKPYNEFDFCFSKYLDRYYGYVCNGSVILGISICPLYYRMARLCTYIQR